MIISLSLNVSEGHTNAVTVMISEVELRGRNF